MVPARPRARRCWSGGAGAPGSCRGDSGASGSMPVLPPLGANAGGASVNSPPAALSQISTEIVSPIAILNNAGWVSCVKRAAKLSFGCARKVETTRSSTSTTSDRISPSGRLCSTTSLAEGPALGNHEQPPKPKVIRQASTATGFIDCKIVNRSARTSTMRLKSQGPMVQNAPSNIRFSLALAILIGGEKQAVVVGRDFDLR